MNVKTDLVKPSSSRNESWLVVGMVALILLGCGIAVGGRRVDDAPQRLFDWQVSAFYDLKPIDQAVYTGLSAAIEELWWIHDDILGFGTKEEKADPWPTVEQLER